MKKYKNVIYGKTLAQYQKKYGKHSESLLTFTEKEIKKYNSYNKVEEYDYLLQGRNWWFIDGTYYEARKRVGTKGLKVALPILLGGGAAAGVIIGVLNIVKNIKPGDTPIIETKYKVTYKAGEGAQISGKSEVTIDENSTIQNAPNATKNGFQLLGWGLDELSSELISFPYKINGPITLFAKWQASAVDTVKIDFRDGDSAADVTPLYIKKGAAVGTDNSLSIPTKTDHKFIGWYYDKTFNNAFNPKQAVNQNTTLYAKFEKNAFTLKFKTTGGQPEGTSPTAEDNVYQMNSISSLNVEPYTEVDTSKGFYGWVNPATSEHIKYPFTVNTDDIVLEADIQSTPTSYKVEFRDEDDSVIQTKDNLVQITTAPEAPIHEGKKFTGWKNKETGEIVTFPVENGYTLTKDVCFIATYEKCEFNVELYTIVDGKTSETPVETRQGCSKIQSDPGFIIENHKLIQWQDEYGKEITFPLEIKDDRKLYAVYGRSSYDVKFFDGDTSTVPVSKIGGAAKLEENDTPQIPGKTNHSLFWGYKNSSGKVVEISFPITIENYTKEDSLNLYSIWKQDRYNLTLNYPDGIHNSITFTDKKKVKLKDLEKYQYQSKDKMCIGWSKVKPGAGEQTLITSDIDLNSNAEIYAVYASRIFNLTINYVDKNGKSTGKAPDTREVKYELGYKTSKITKPEEIDVEGYQKQFKFSHWAKSKSTVGTPIEEIDITGNTEIYAVYGDAYQGTYEYLIKGEDFTHGIDKFTTYKTSITKTDIISRMPDLTSDGYVRESKVYYYEGDYTEKTKLIEITDETFSITGFYHYVCIYVKNSFSVEFQNENGKTYYTLPEKKPSGYVIKTDEVPETPTIEGKVFNGYVEVDEEGKEVSETVDFVNGYTIENHDVRFKAVSDRPTKAVFKIPEALKSIAHFEKSDKTTTTDDVPVEAVTLNEMTTAQFSGDYKLVIDNNNYAFDGWFTDSAYQHRAAFPYKDARDRSFILRLTKQTESCSVHLDSGDGQFQGGSKQILLTPKIGTKYEDLSGIEGYQEPELTNFTFKNWTIYDQAAQKYIDVPTDYVFKYDVTLLPKYVEEIKPTSGTEADFTTNDNWATVAHWAELGEAKFVEHYSFLNNDINNIVGKKRIISLNGKDCEVSVVGTNHDTISGSTNKTALLTFSLLDTPYKAGWNISVDPSNRNNWSLSTARIKLKEGGLFYNSIDTTVVNHAQTVNKSTRKGTSDTSTYKTLEVTQDKFFLFSGTELGLVGSTYDDNLDSSTVSEGSTYKAFINSTAADLKRKYNGSYDNYWLRSPYNKSFREAPVGTGVNWMQSGGTLFMNGGEMPSYYTDTAKAYIFGFAIGVKE